MTQKPRIFIGPGDIGNWGMLLKRYFQEQGYSVEHVTETPPLKGHSYYPVDKCLNLRGEKRRNIILQLIIRSYYLGRIILKKDVVFFIGGRSFFDIDELGPLPLLLELAILRLFKKKIIAIFVGCDLRHHISAEKEAKRLGSYEWHMCKFCIYRKSKCSYTYKKIKAALFERYANLIYTHSAGRFFFKKKHVPMTILLDVDNIEFKVPDTKKIKIFHAPSNKYKKGTHFIMPILEKIEKHYKNVEIKLLYEVPNYEVLENFKNGHILVNQIAAYDYGQVGVEAMASGCVVLSSSLRTNDEIPEFPKNCPVVFVNHDNLEEKLRFFIEHPDEIKRKATAGRIYAEEYHDYRKVGGKMLNSILTSFNRS